jgi:transcriptional antiterminator RfaH
MYAPLSSASRVWAVLSAKPRKEAPALAFLSKEGYEAYCPLLLARRDKAVPTPLFPGYLFVWLSPSMELPDVRHFPCIRRALTFGDTVACVETELVDHWREREGGRGYLMPDAPPAFDVGQRVRFKEGVFAGLEATVIANLPARERVRVLLEHLGMEVPVEADRSVLN